MAQIGDRVGAILLSGSETEIRLLGYGVYDGVQPFNDEPGAFGNPRITLDDGRVVWGCQCWWGAEAKMVESIGDREVVLVDLDDNPLPEPAPEAVAVPP